MPSKKIAVVTPTFLPYRGGMCVVAEQDASQLAALGHEVDVLIPGRSGGGQTGGYQVKPVRAWLRWGKAAFLPGLTRICRGYDLVVLHYPFYGGAEPVALAKRLRRIPRLALYYHMDTLGHGVVRAVSAVHAATFRPWIMNSVDRFLVTSFDYARSSALAPRFKKKPELFRELPPAVDVERFQPRSKPADLMQRYQLTADRPIILFVGGMDAAHYFKGVPIILQALACEGLETAQAVLVGGGELVKQYQAEAERLGLADRVTFTGPVSEQDLPRHYNLADAFAFPSTDRSEAFGIAALEAMSSGLPVVASDLPGVRTIVRPGETGFLANPGSVSSLASQLLKILVNGQQVEGLGRSARQMALDEYSEQRRLEKWERLSAELLK